MNKIENFFRQRGAISAVTLFFILVVVSLFLLISLRMTSMTNIDTMEQSDAVETLYLAESALERGSSRLNRTGLCDASITDATPIALARGSVQVISATLTTRCTLKTAGLFTQLGVPRISYIQANYDTLALPGFNFSETFPSAIDFNANWATTLIQNQGTVSYNAYSGGVFSAVTSGGASTDSHLEGYSRRVLNPTTPTGSAGRSGLLSFRYQKTTATGVPANRIDLSISLFDSVAGVGQVIWSSTTKNNMAAFTTVTNFAFTLTPIYNFDELRISYFLDEQSKRQVSVYVDDMVITIPGTGGGWTLTDWRQVDQ